MLLLLQVCAMYDAYKSPAVTLDAKQLLAWNMIMVRHPPPLKEFPHTHITCSL
jgi:hypothetical protein